MKFKFLFIGLLIFLLAIIVNKMLEYERSSPQQQVRKEYVKDESKPLIHKLPLPALKKQAAQTDYYFRTGDHYFKNLRYTFKNKSYQWNTFFMKGVNIGVALPGKLPSEFSLSYEGYLEWLKKIGKMNANVIRIYTILPPEFYEALAHYNLMHYDQPLYLLQGVWASAPEDHNYYNKKYTRECKKEIMDVLDVVHGNAVLEPEAGKASGTYVTDVSEYVAGILFGREWEPTAVHKTIRENRETAYNGDFIHVNNGNAMEAWLANMLDFIVLYETQNYKMQHPVSFVNWLPLDPMYHNTEIIGSKKVREYDNDLEYIDFTHFHNTPLFMPGIFASYHVYPYYPDFVYLQEDYAQATNQQGEPDNYYGYLQDLKQHNKGMPLIIAEYGLPSSRGDCHQTPFGFDQGGHSEAEQAAYSLTLTKDIFHTGCGGAIYFEWADEWFKHNWLVMKFEKPFEDRALWHNMENPEQNFGICALESREKTIDGQLNDWHNQSFSGTSFQYVADADPAYFYLSLKSDRLDLEQHNLYIAIDTYGKEKGDHKLPFSDKLLNRGFEFLAELVSRDSARLLVDDTYSVFTDIYNDSVPVYASKKNKNGKFVEQHLLTNRGRKTLLGEHIDSVLFNRSPLEHGNSSLPEHSNADWYWNDSTGALEMRLTWHLLNVSDPAQRYVLDDQPGTDQIEYSRTDRFRIYFFRTDTNGNKVKQIPAGNPFSFTWDTWEQPEYSTRLKPLYDTLKAYFKHLTPRQSLKKPEKPAEDSISIASFYNNKKQAVTFSFDNAGFSQQEVALPVLKKYRVKGSFGLLPGLLNKAPGHYTIDDAGRLKRLGVNHAQNLYNKNHDLAVQIIKDFNLESNNLRALEEKLGKNIYLEHYMGDFVNEYASDTSIIFSRKIPLSNTVECKSDDAYPYCAVRASQVTQKQLDSLFTHNPVQWYILNYFYLFEKRSLKMRDYNKDLYIPQSDFEWNIRLARNKRYWLGSELSVFQYLKERKHTTIKKNQHKDLLFLTIETDLNEDKFHHPLTIKYQTRAPFVKISGSETDGIYRNRTGTLYFNALPNKEVTIEKMY